ncbi:MAG: polyprenyl synthetase family protein [Desulfatiglandales bacterium]
MTSDNPILERFGDHYRRIDEELERVLDSRVDMINDIGEHSLLGQGKRLRPLLFALSGQLCGYGGDDLFRLSVIFECLHTGSLLHDDVLDNAETRRKKPAVREVWGNHASVLGGDFLYLKAIEMALDPGNLKLLQVLSESSLQMVEGQILELMNTDNWALSKEDYMEIIIDKTAALMAAACSCGAILAGAEREAVENLHGFGLNLGIAFQLIDDVLDYTSCEEEFGKPVGKDLREGKITLPLIYSLSGLEKDETQRLEGLFKKGTAGEGDYAEVIALVRSGKAIEKIRSEAKDHVAKASGYLDCFAPSSVKDDLLALNDYIVERRF